MIGLGKWTAKVNTLFFSGYINAEIKDNNGEYEVDFDLPEKFKNVEIKYYDIHDDGKNTLRGKAEVSLLAGKVFELEAVFDSDKVEATLFLPFLGNKQIKSKDGHRID